MTPMTVGAAQQRPASDEAPTVLRLGPPPGSAALTVVAVHGRDQGPAYLVDHLVEPIGRSDLAWVLPASSGTAWYPGSFLDDPAVNRPDLEVALDRLASIEDELSEAVGADRIVWAGFSQGACLVCEHVARRPRARAGALVFTGGRVGPPGTDLTIAGDLAGTPIYLAARRRDPWAPTWRIHETADAFRAAGAEVVVDLFPGDDHVISADEIARATQLITDAAGR